MDRDIVSGPDGADKSTVNMYDENRELVDSVLKGNSASTELATKIEKILYDGTKVTLRDGLGTRFTHGLTSELIAANSTVGAESEYDAFSWDETDMSFTTSDPSTDPVAIPKPQGEVRPSYVVTSPTNFCG